MRVFEFAQMQLGSREHYDFGLRAVKVIVEKAGLLKLVATGVVSLDQDEIEKAQAKIDAHF